MKKLLVLLLTGMTFCAWSQGFEGTIKWSMKMDVNDPAMKAGQQKMNDPANQAKMKEMEAKMNDPQFKKMMEANPQLKAQMENVMKMQSGGNIMENAVGKGMIVKIKGNNSITVMEGGMMAGEILNQGDKNQTVKINRQNKSYYIFPTAGAGAPGQSHEAPKPTITKTSETTTILNYNCTKYIVTIQERGQTISTAIWTTTDIKDIDLKSLAKQKMNRGQSMFYEGMDGVPLRIETMLPNNQGKMTMEVTEIKKESLNASDFTIPADFTESKSFMGGKN